MPTEVVTKVVNGRRVPRAILPRRIDRVADDVDTIAVGLADVDRPGTVLERAFVAGRTSPQRLVVTGARGSGKSRWCAALVAAARGRGLRVAGVASPAVLEGGRKVAIDVVDLMGDARRRLAELRRADEPGTATQRWRFDEEALAWGNAALRAAAAAPVDLLVVDELGSRSSSCGARGSPRAWRCARRRPLRGRLRGRAARPRRRGAAPLARRHRRRRGGLKRPTSRERTRPGPRGAGRAGGFVVAGPPRAVADPVVDTPGVDSYTRAR
jgi:hypothetical protein